MLTHYIVVRRDMPLGDICAQIAHAAGESFYQLASTVWTVPSPFTCCAMPGTTIFPGSSVAIERHVSNVEVGGSIPSRGASFNPSDTVVVVLGARNQGRLARLERQLTGNSIAHVAIRETDGPLAGQLTAIGLVPGPREALGPHVREFHMIRFDEGNL